jgi:hypothetical protein
MTAPLSTIAPRLHQLLLMLSSNQPGEVATAAAAIGRTLKSAGADWHVLADGLLQIEAPQPEEPEDADTDDVPEDWHTMRAACLRDVRLLREREREFLISLGHWHGDLTDKQLNWLTSIYARVRRHAA